MEVWIETLIQNQVLASLIEIIISGIIILSAIIYVNVIFKKSSPKDLDAEREFKEDWKGTIEDFIEYKKFQYDRGFGLLKEITPYIIFFLTLLLIASKDVILGLVGQSIYYSLFISEGLIILILILRVAGGNGIVLKNIRILLENKKILKKFEKVKRKG